MVWDALRVVTEKQQNKKETRMSKSKLAFFGWSKYGQEIYLYDSPTHYIKYVHEKVDGNLSEPLDGDELADSI